MKITAGLSEGQVLQRLGKNSACLQLQGACRSTGTIYVTVSKKGRSIPGWKKVAAGKAGNGAFSVSLKGIPTGGPYCLELQVEKETLRVRTFFVGDVWLLAGQSNMEGMGDMTHPAKPHPLVRSFSLRREWALARDPLHVLRESPDVCHHGDEPLSASKVRQFRRQAKKGVGVGIFFAREMLQRSGVPQGLICTAHGGTSMMQWDPDLKNQEGASLYYSMMASLRATGQPVVGVLWYQGESDASDAQKIHYTDRMKKLVTATRRDLRQPALPWVVVQIGRVVDERDQVAAWNDIQEQQRLLPGQIKNLETVASVDLPLDDFIHISATGYPRLGARLAHVADHLVYKNKKSAGPPRLRKIHLSNSANTVIGPGYIDVVFDQVVGALKAGGEPVGFTLVRKDGTAWPYIYKTTLHGRTARLHLAQAPPDDLKLHYGHGIMPVCNLTDGRDLSLPSFGPLPLRKKKAYLPFVTTWQVADAVHAHSIPLAKLTCPDMEPLNTTVKKYGSNGFINEHEVWLKKNGHAYFAAQIELPEPMKLKFLMGYDGPFRLWVDSVPVFTDLKGCNPCLPDQSNKTLDLKSGRHRLTVAMDINHGLAWGFMLRFLRLDISKAQLNSGSYGHALYSV